MASGSPVFAANALLTNPLLINALLTNALPRPDPGNTDRR